MLSRAANVPHVCFAKRLTSILFTRPTLNGLSLHSRREWIERRCYSSDPVIHSKEKIEALISGRISAREFNKSIRKPTSKASKRRTSRKPGRRRKDDIPDWGLGASPTEKEPTRGAGAAHILEDDAVNELPGGLADELADEELLAEQIPAEELHAEKPRAEEPDHLEQASPRDGPMITEEVTAEPGHFKPKRRPRHRRDFRDELVQARSVPVAALGEQIEAIMLKNPNQMKRPKRSVRRVQGETTEARVELDSERDEVVEHSDENSEEAMEAALKNIDDLRPADKTVLRMRDFDILADTLLEGFNHNQLTRYFIHKRLEMSQQGLGKPVTYPWIVKQGPWVAAKPDHWGPLRPKQRQVIMIMQLLWNLEVQEQVEGLGRTLLWLQPRVFELIAPPNSVVLEQLSKDFLYQSNKEKITTSFDECRINIYARKSTIPVILSHLDEVVKSIQCQKISSDHFQEQDLDEGLLQELERITKTHIEYKEKERELEISWLGKQDLASLIEDAKNTETPADVALRLLLEQPTKEQQSSVHIFAPSESKKPQDGTFISHQRENRSMSWKDKLRQWSRYVVPVGQAAAARDDVSVQLAEAIPFPVSTPKAPKGIEQTCQVTASFGHVLHGRSSRTVPAMAKHRRLLSPVLPHPASFTSLSDEDKPMAQRATIVLNFFPDPTQAPTKLDSAPPSIQLRLPADLGADLADFSLPPDSALFGVAAKHISDVLLPSESVDVRLTQTHLLPLDPSQEFVKEFISQCEFNPPRGLLKTPSKATFSIPKAWVTSPKATGRPSKATINVPYIFVGSEIHQAVELEFHGHTLCYSSIDAGRHGGRRQELSLQAGPPQSKDATPLTLDKAEASRFLSLVGRVAAGDYFSWHNGSQLMRNLTNVDALEDEAVEDHMPLLEAEDHEDAQNAESEHSRDVEQEDGHPSIEPAADSIPDGPSQDSQSLDADETQKM
ncbi:mitochondrial inner-membrane-bound regulator domain-containing protein [Trichoderma novae-zelandiae]